MSSKTNSKGKAKRGFACMSPEKRTEIARKGGAAVRPDQRSFSKSNALAAAAGRKGGLARGEAKARRRASAAV